MKSEIEKIIYGRGQLKWQIAKKLGIADATLSRWLREPTPEQYQAILNASDDLLKGE